MNQVKPALFVPDTWAIWNPDDKRTTLCGSSCSIQELKTWYGIKSSAWSNLVNSKELKPEIMIVGENPSKNNTKVIEKTNISIQCFHTNSIL